MSLRLTLLLAGLALLALIYVISVLQRRRRRYPRVRREPRLHATESGAPEVDDDELVPEADDDLSEHDEVQGRPLPPALMADSSEELGELPTLRRDTDDEVEPASPRERKRRGRKRDNQMELNFESAGDDSPPQPVKPGVPSSDTATEPDQLLVIYLKAPGAARFAGKDLREAFDIVDMRLGPMNIFHHYGVGAMQSQASLFSAANMFEPGTFDYATMDGTEVGGLAMFLPLP
ncbi:MAG: hypothetical protein HKO62_08725, partial [Gammaproteobacteria bacterium]|nr:hypothetical protein [Gammaproteobacteria bacterium]